MCSVLFKTHRLGFYPLNTTTSASRWAMLTLCSDFNSPLSEARSALLVLRSPQPLICLAGLIFEPVPSRPPTKAGGPAAEAHVRPSPLSSLGWSSFVICLECDYFPKKKFNFLFN